MERMKKPNTDKPEEFLDTTVYPADDSGHSHGYLPQVAKGAMINFSGAIMRMVLLYAYTLVLARVLSVNELGEYFLMFTVINILGLAATVGLDFGVVRYTALYLGEEQNQLVRKTIKVALVLGVPIGVATMVGVFFVAPLLQEPLFDNNPDAIAGLRVFAIAIPFLVLAKLLNASTQGMHKMQYQVYSRDIGEQASKFGLSVMVVLLGIGLAGIIWANVVAVAIAAALAALFVIKALPRPQPALRSQPITRRLFRYSLPLAFSNILGMVLIWVDMLLLGYLSTPTDVGFYGAALRVVTVSAIILIAFATVFTPMISDLYNRGEKRELEAIFKTVTRWVLICVYPVFLLLIVFTDAIMGIFGAEYTAGSEALRFLSLGQFINASIGLSGMMVLMSGRSQMELLNIGTALIVNVVLCFLLIPDHGIIGAAVANLSAMVVVNVMRVVEVWIFMRINAFNLAMANPLLVGLVSITVVALPAHFVFGEVNIVELVPLLLAVLVVYLLLLLAFGLNEQDKTVIKMVRSRIGNAETE